MASSPLVFLFLVVCSAHAKQDSLDWKKNAVVVEQGLVMHASGRCVTGLIPKVDDVNIDKPPQPQVVHLTKRPSGCLKADKWTLTGTGSLNNSRYGLTLYHLGVRDDVPLLMQASKKLPNNFPMKPLQLNFSEGIFWRLNGKGPARCLGPAYEESPHEDIIKERVLILRDECHIQGETDKLPLFRFLTMAEFKKIDHDIKKKKKTTKEESTDRGDNKLVEEDNARLEKEGTNLDDIVVKVFGEQSEEVEEFERRQEELLNESPNEDESDFSEDESQNEDEQMDPVQESKPKDEF